MFSLFKQTIPHQQAAQDNAHVTGRSWSTPGKGHGREQSNVAGLLLQPALEELSAPGDRPETQPRFPRKLSAAIHTVMD